MNNNIYNNQVITNYINDISIIKHIITINPVKTLYRNAVIINKMITQL